MAARCWRGGGAHAARQPPGATKDEVGGGGCMCVRLAGAERHQPMTRQGQEVAKGVEGIRMVS